MTGQTRCTTRHEQLATILALAVDGHTDDLATWVRVVDHLMASDVVADMLAQARDAGRREQARLNLLGRANAQSAGIVEGERIGAARALIDAADVVARVREGAVPDGVWSHPSAEHFERWLRTRASLARADAEDPRP